MNTCALTLRANQCRIGRSWVTPLRERNAFSTISLLKYWLSICPSGSDRVLNRQLNPSNCPAWTTRSWRRRPFLSKNSAQSEGTGTPCAKSALAFCSWS
jgi:hypothetical protein